MYCFRKHSSFKSAFIPPPQRMSHRPSPPSGQPTKPVVVSSVSLRSESGWTCSCQTLIYSLHGHAYPTSGDTLIRSVLYLVYYIVYSYDALAPMYPPPLTRWFDTFSSAWASHVRGQTKHAGTRDARPTHSIPSHPFGDHSISATTGSTLKFRLSL